MVDSALNELEVQAETLIASCKRLEHENDMLRNKQVELLAEKQQLLEKNRAAVEKIRQLLNKLKAINHES